MSEYHFVRPHSQCPYHHVLQLSRIKSILIYHCEANTLDTKLLTEPY